MVAIPKMPEAPPLAAPVLRAYDGRSFLYFDIETIPDQRETTLKSLRDNVKAPSQYKKPESIADWLVKNRESAAQEALAKTSLDGGAGHVCTIGWARNDGSVCVEHACDVGEESEVIEAFFSEVKKGNWPTLVGHNIASFDIPFLIKRAIVLGIDLPVDGAFPRNPKPWDRSIFDTMTAWAGARDMVSLNRLCGILGVVGKSGFDGSDVAEAWKNGEHETIAAYCDDDVRRVRSIHQKFLMAGF